jgi:hypothetical protein
MNSREEEKEILWFVASMIAATILIIIGLCIK